MTNEAQWNTTNWIPGIRPRPGPLSPALLLLLLLLLHSPSPSQPSTLHPPPSTLSLRSSPTILCFYNRLVVRHSQRVRWFVPPGIACPLWDWASWGYRIIGPVWDWASGITCPMWDWASWIIGLHVQCGTGPLGLWNCRSSVGLGLLDYGIIGPVWDWAS